jgi:hypothetical protein
MQFIKLQQLAVQNLASVFVVARSNNNLADVRSFGRVQHRGGFGINCSITTLRATTPA